jgi:hypothetical protein
VGVYWRSKDILENNWESIGGFETTRSSSYNEASAAIRDKEVARRLRASLKVTYLHRTVKDFLKTDRIRARLQRSAPQTNFDPHLSLLISYVVNLQRGIRSYHYADKIVKGETENMKVMRIAWEVVDLAGKIEAQNRYCGKILREFYKAASQWLAELPMDFLLKCKPWGVVFSELVAYHGLYRYMDEFILKDQSCLSPPRRPGYYFLLPTWEVLPTSHANFRTYIWT